MENVICGFIELNGELVKISSVEDIKAIANKLGSAFMELTVSDYKNLCEEMQGEYRTDDCGVLYSRDGRKVYFAPITSEEYIIRSGTIVIANYAFSWHSCMANGFVYTSVPTCAKNINNLLIPDSVIAIGVNAFSDNLALNNVIVSQKLEYIGPRAFSGCWNMDNLHLPSSVKYIEVEAFAGCRNAFKELTIPVSTRHIGSHAFRECTSLEKVIFSSSVDTIGSGIFESCDKLSKIVVPKGCIDQFREQLPFYSEIITDTSEEE